MEGRKEPTRIKAKTNEPESQSSFILALLRRTAATLCVKPEPLMPNGFHRNDKETKLTHTLRRENET